MFQNNMDQDIYGDIITETLLPFAYIAYGRDFVIHQDNSPIHTAGSITTIFRENMVRCPKIPPHSPDLNPIELIWADMKRYIRSRFCVSIGDIQRCVQEYHTSLMPKKCASYINHMRKVMQIIIEKDGGWSNM